ncbi:hypothetical protein AAC387_Pa10g1781 [Persea americana]
MESSLSRPNNAFEKTLSLLFLALLLSGAVSSAAMRAHDYPIDGNRLLMDSGSIRPQKVPPKIPPPSPKPNPHPARGGNPLRDDSSSSGSMRVKFSHPPPAPHPNPPTPTGFVTRPSLSTEVGFSVSDILRIASPLD